MSIFRRANTITVDRDAYLELVDRASSKAATAHLAGVQVVEVGFPTDLDRDGFTAARIEQLLRRHYIEVLGSAEGRKMWRRLLREATAVDTVAKLGQPGRR